MSTILKWLRNLAALTGCLALVVTMTPLVPWWAHQLARPWGNCQGASLVVLAGNGLGDDILGDSSYWRAVYTIRLLRQHHYKQVIISGHSTESGKSAAELMRDFLAGHAIDISTVRIETESSTTLENAIQSKKLLGDASHGQIDLLTSDFHVWRAFRVFRKAGIAVQPCPVPDVLKRANSWPSRIELFVALATETVKIGWYEWKGWI